MVKSTKKQSPKPKQGLAPVRDERSPTNKRIRWIVVAPLALFAMAVTAFFYVSIGPQSTSLLKSPVDVPPPAFVGSDACIGCHKAEGDLWRASQHNHAMAHATEQTVLGDFSDVKFEKFGVQSRFFRRDGKFLVETDGPDGKLATFEIKYTFGVDPLQQYLIEFPDGRLQALSIAWDVRPRDKGGQRWFHLYPDEEIKHDDVLHWTKLNQNWNFMCAECHSTGVRKNYDSRNDRFATTWAEISVGCEGCHGQGSHHLDWARRQKSWWPFGKTDDPLKGLLVYFNERQDVTWLPDAKTGNAKRSAAPVALRKEVETCGLCHARRSQISEGWVPGRSLSDTHVVSPLSRGLYYPDGQMHDEVYNYGSFKQSKMFASGVTCSDCHEPHSAKPKLSGNDTCVQCHSPEKYSVAAHHHHDATKAEVTCASCHMPARTYMVVDVRHDHSFRVPRPDLSAKHETPNACTDCHSDKSAAWAATEVERWYGPVRKGFQNYAEAFHAAWGGEMNAATQLAAIATDGNVPAFTRAGALTELGSYLSSATVDTARKGLADPDPMVRIGSLDMLDRLPLEQRISVITPLLTDPVRGVRIRAVSLLAGVPDAQFPAGTRERFDRAAAEFIAALRLNADRPEANSTVGRFYAQRGRTDLAESEYNAALKLSPQYAPAAINLADLYRQMGREPDGEFVLKVALGKSPGDAGLHHALGLTFVRLKKLDEALAQLRSATELEPGRARYAYVYAVALHSNGNSKEAITVLKSSLTRHPGDSDVLRALISFEREAGDVASALEHAELLAKVAPNDQGLAGVIRELQRQVGTPTAR